jgi:hypothetical protein
MFSTLFKKITDLFERNLYLLYIFFLFFTICLSITYSYFYVEKFSYQFNEINEVILKLIPFGYGPLIENLYYFDKYEQTWYGITTYLTRLPFIPFFITMVGKISLNVYFIIIVKNIIFFSVIFYCVYLFSYNYKKRLSLIILLLSLFFYNFYNTIVLSTYVFADTYIATLLPCTFMILMTNIKKKYLLISIMIFVMFFTKTTMFFLSIFITLSFLVVEKKLHIFKRALPLLLVVMGILIWGSFGMIKTQKFPIGSTMLSNNQEALSIVMNKDFKKYYPRISVDLIPRENVDNKFDNEWKFNEYFKKKNKEYFKDNKLDVFKDVFIKLRFIFFNFRKDSIHADINSDYENPIMLSHIMNRLIFISSLIILLKNIYINSLNKKFENLDLYFFIIVCCSLFPHVVGWATSKHLVPLFIVSHIYLILRLKYFKNFIQ